MSEHIKLINDLKKHEGFVPTKYKDTLGFDTQGYGTKLPLRENELKLVSNLNNWTQQEAEALLIFRLNGFVKRLKEVKGDVIARLSDTRKAVLFNMSYQMGVRGVLSFKKMWKALEDENYDEAASQMLNSKWAKFDSPKRARGLAEKMRVG